MSYDDSLYEYDRNSTDYEAKLKNGAYLYRLASVTHAGMDEALNGGGPLNSPQYGRFNVPNQRASYCANNVVVCIAEVLHHMYRTALARIEEAAPAKLIRDSFRAKRALVIFRVNEIDNLVYTDGSDVKIDFEPRMGGTATVHPWLSYEKDTLISRFNNLLRHKGKRGVLYPSARHSKDICVALFQDETSRIDRSFYKVLNVELCLLPETQPLRTPFIACEPFIDKLHPTMGYYSFADPTQLANAKNDKIINPANLPDKGIVNFVRRQYNTYPAGTVWP